MATEAQLIAALRQADAAGDHQGATRIAQMIQAQRANPQGDLQARTSANVSGLNSTIADVKAHPTRLTNAPRVLGAVSNFASNAFGIPFASALDKVTTPVVGAVNNAFGTHYDPRNVSDQIINAGGLLLGGGEANALKTDAPHSITSLTSPEASAVSKMAARAKLNPADMTAQAQRFTDAGVAPTVADVAGNSGRRIIRANASRVGPASDAVQNAARSKALGLPDRISSQARTHISADPRNPNQIASQLTATRTQQGDIDFGLARHDPVQLTPEAVAALRTKYGRGAIQEAADRELDPDVRAALNRLSADSLDNPSTPVTAGMMQSISDILFGKAQAKAADPSLSGSLSSLALSIRNAARSQSESYADALRHFEAGSSLIDAAGTGEDFLKRNTDEFRAATNAMTPDELTLAQATARRATERAAAENAGSAPGVADRIAYAPEQQARNAALLGPARATKLQNAMAAEVESVRNAQQIAPQTGSWSANNLADNAMVNGVGTALNTAGSAVAASHGNFFPAIRQAISLWSDRHGFSPQEAESLSQLAIDPSRTSAALDYISGKAGAPAANDFLSIIRAGAQGALGDSRPQPATLPAAFLSNAFSGGQSSQGQATAG